MLHHFPSSLVLLTLLTITIAAPYEATPRRLHEPDDWTQRQHGDDCPRYLEEGEFEPPHYMTRVSAREPGRAYGRQYVGAFTAGDVSTVFRFDVPASQVDANCALEFLFPRREQITATSWFSYAGQGTFVFALLDACPGPETTFDDLQPRPSGGVEDPTFSPVHMEPGHAYSVDLGPCAEAVGKRCIAAGE